MTFTRTLVRVPWYCRLFRVDINDPIPRNPWTDIHCGREFMWDVRHPLDFFRRGLYGVAGANPKVTKQERFAGLMFMLAGGIYVFGGVILVVISGVTGHGWLP